MKNWICAFVLLCSLFTYTKVFSTPINPKKLTLTSEDIDAMMKSLSNWGRWGKEDQLGAINLITPQKKTGNCPGQKRNLHFIGSQCY